MRNIEWLIKPPQQQKNKPSPKISSNSIEMYYSIPEASKALNINRSIIDNGIRKRAIPCRELGKRKRLVRLSEICNYIETQQI